MPITGYVISSPKNENSSSFSHPPESCMSPPFFC